MVQHPTGNTSAPALTIRQAADRTGLANTGNQTRTQVLGAVGLIAAGVVLLLGARMARKAGH